MDTPCAARAEGTLDQNGRTSISSRENDQPAPLRALSDHPVIVTILFLVAIAGLIVAVLSYLGDESERAKSATSTTNPALQPSEATTATLPASTSAAPTQSVSTPSSTAVQWNNLIRLGSGVDLDKIPPTLKTDAKNADLREASAFFVSSIEANSQSLALWEDSTSPTRQKCADLIASTGTTEWGDEGGEDVVAGQIFCIKTSEGRIAALKIKNDSYHNMTATAKVWAAQDSVF